MDSKTSGKQHLAFTDAEINAAESIACTMIREGDRFTADRVIEVYERLLDVTAEAKLRLKYELTTVKPTVEGFEP
jgi:hypothetical protein